MLAKGDYLIVFDSNCFFSQKNTLQNIYNEIKKSDVDILEFNLYKILPNDYIFLYKCNHLESRFNLTQIKYNMEFNNIDIKEELLTNKIIKSIYFKNIIKKYELEKFNEIIDHYYNNIFEFIFETHNYKFKRISSESIYMNDIDSYKPKFNNFKSGEDKRKNELFLINSQKYQINQYN